MKKLFSIVLSLLLLTGCLNKFDSAKAKEKWGCDVLNLYITGEYISDDVLSNFEYQYGVRVNVSLFASNEEMYTKLLGGTVYDVIIPSDYMIERLIAEGMLQKIDKTKITNMQYLDENVLNKPFDMNNDYSVPYFWGNVGIVYDSTKVDQKDVESQGWEVFRNPKYKGMIYIYDSERDAFMIALKALGYSMNTKNEEELKKAYEWHVKLAETMDPAYVTDEAIDGLTYGEKAMGFMYSGDAATILANNENMRFFVPEEGTNVWTDSMVIHKDSKCSKLAHEFINYMIDYDNAYDNSLYVGYTSPNAEVIRDITGPEGEFEGNDAYVPRSGNEKDECFESDERIRKIISDYWVKVKNH